MQTIAHPPNFKKEIDTSLFAWWFANYGKVSPLVEPSPVFFTNPQISPYNPYFRIANPLSKRGGDITSHITVTYSYDDLNRLITATASVASSSPYVYTYSYSAIGNISSSTPSGAYSYAGTNYANPHAATQIGGSTQTYDNNGNLTSDGTWNNSWNYRNQLTQSAKGNGTATRTYLYDENSNRVKLTEGNTTTYFLNKYFNQIGTTGTTTKHIFAGDLLVATIEKLGSATSTVHYIHTDHLGGTNAITDSTGALSQVLDFLPFGATRIDSKSGGYGGEKVQFAGTQKDALNGLNYMSARYQNPVQGRFISEDPSFLSIGDEQMTKQNTGKSLKEYLMDPQALNSYSYAGNNPIIMSDPTGKYLELSAGGTAMGWSGAVGFRASTKGLNFFIAGGGGVGLEGSPFTVSYTPGDVSHTVDSSVSVGGSYVPVVGGGVSVSGKYEPRTVSLQNQSTQVSVAVGFGGDIYARKEISIPLLGGEAPAGLVLARTSQYSTPNYVPAPVKNTTQTISTQKSSVSGLFYSAQPSPRIQWQGFGSTQSQRTMSSKKIK
ncbi:MAG: hypothetical protein NTZ13_01055 [Candidatus Parcubacteria bacterium]|nr:hypothetical protein [Candidatus Parcubacteria bacterium]